jgi:hypothetical protein
MAELGHFWRLVYPGHIYRALMECQTGACRELALMMERGEYISVQPSLCRGLTTEVHTRTWGAWMGGAAGPGFHFQYWGGESAKMNFLNIDRRSQRSGSGDGVPGRRSSTCKSKDRIPGSDTWLLKYARVPQARTLHLKPVGLKSVLKVEGVPGGLLQTCLGERSPQWLCRGSEWEEIPDSGDQMEKMTMQSKKGDASGLRRQLDETGVHTLKYIRLLGLGTAVSRANS